ncbi:hypothetical protein R4B61_02505 [Fructilactobacillus vespulae]|uniref:hypothetical protein n=1 Tax=Fructilactobacillus vespulae TaxID=1249630 RepID=UPI0039B45389
MKSRNDISQKVLDKEIQVFGTNPVENKDVTDFRVAIALGNANSDYLDPKIISKSSLGNIYTIWLMTYVSSPALNNLSEKAIDSLIKEYDFRDDVDDTIDEHNFAKYLDGELSIDDIKAKLDEMNQ